MVAALSFAAVRGNAEAYAPPVELATPMPGARATCRAMRGLVGAAEPARIQDPYGLRALPQAHGILLDALSSPEFSTIEAFANAPSENPSILSDGSVAHHGGFHAGYLALASDTAAIAAIQSAQLGLNRLTYVSEPNHTGLEPFLGDGTPGASGVMVVEYVAAAALGDLRAAAAPASTQSITLSRGIEDTASFASLAARKLPTAADRYELLVACELVAALRAIRMSEPALSVAQQQAVALCAGPAGRPGGPGPDRRHRDRRAAAAGAGRPGGAQEPSGQPSRRVSPAVSRAHRMRRQPRSRQRLTRAGT